MAFPLPLDHATDHALQMYAAFYQLSKTQAVVRILQNELYLSPFAPGSPAADPKLNCDDCALSRGVADHFSTA